MAFQFKLSLKRGQRAQDVVCSAGSAIAGSDAAELNVDATRMTKFDLLVLIEQLEHQIHRNGFPQSAGGSPPPPSAVLVTAPSISGARGGVLTATPAVFTGATSVSRQWFADGIGTGNTTLVYTDSDTAATLEYRETALPGSVAASAFDGAVANAVTNSFDPAHKTAGVDLTAANMHADVPGSGTLDAVHTLVGFAAGTDVYFEETIGKFSGTCALALYDGSAAFNPGVWPGDSGDTHAFSFISDGSSYGSDAGNGVGGQAFGDGAVLSVHLSIDSDGTGATAWIKVNGVESRGSAATRTGGYRIANIGTPIFAGFASIFGHNASTIKFGPPFAYSPEAGFSYATGTTATVLVNPQSSGQPGKYQLDISASTSISGATGLRYKIEAPSGALIQGWTNLSFSAGSGSGTFLIPQWTYEGQTFRVLVENVGGASTSITAITSTAVPYALQQSMKIGLNDGFLNHWNPQVPGRDIFEAITLHPSDNMDLVTVGLNAGHDGGILPAGNDFNDYAHWNEVYNPAQNYPTTTDPSNDNYMVTVYNGVQWRRTVRTPRSGVAPDPNDSLGATSGWMRYNQALGSVVGLDARGMPTKLPDDTNLTIRFAAPWFFKPSRYPVTVHCKTEPGVKIALQFASNVTMTNINLGAGTFDLVYVGDGDASIATQDTDAKFYIDRSGAAISSNFFISGVPSYETGVPAADIGAPYVGADKLADFAPMHATRNMSGQPTNRSWVGIHNGMTAANSVPTGGRRLWKYNVDMANSQDAWLIANGKGHGGIWVNVQDQADDTYMDAMAAFYLANLNPGITVYLELGNERWNGAVQFHQGVELIARAAAAGITTGQLHAREHKAMIGRWRTAWGASASRVKGVLAWQAAASQAVWQGMLDFENAYQFTDYIAIATYWGTENYLTGDNPTMDAAIAGNNYAAFEAAADTMMRGLADAEVAVIKSYCAWLPAYSVSKGLSKNAILFSAYEGSPALIINGGGTGTAFAGQYKRSAAMGATYADWLDKLATQCPHTFMAFDYDGPANSWTHMDRMGNQSDQPYAALRAKAIAVN